MTPGALLADVVLAVWGLVVLLVTLTPAPGNPAEDLPSFCLVCGEIGVSNLVLNVALYLPLGFLLRSRRSTWSAAAILAAAVSLGVEVAQVWIPGRHSSLADLAANAVGGASGAAVWPVRGVLHAASGRTARVLAWAWSVLAAAWILLFAVAMRPSALEGPLFGQWTPALGGRDPYGGSVLRATVGDLPVPHGSLPRSPEIGPALAAGRDVLVRFVIGPPARDAVAVLRVVDDVGREAFQLGTEGYDLVLRDRYVADNVGLTRPHLRLDRALRGHAVGDTLEVEVSRGSGYDVRAGAYRIADRRFPVARSWSVLRYPGAGALPPWVLDVLWSFVLLVPAGYWMDDRSRVGVPVPPLLALAVAPWVSPVLGAAPAAIGLGVCMLAVGAGLRAILPTE